MGRMREGGIVREVGINMGTLLYLKWINSKDAVTSARHLPESGPRSTSAAAAKSLQSCPTPCDSIDA